MLKRNLALIVVGGLLLGGVAVAWANGPAVRPSMSTSLAAAQAAANDPSTAPADRQALRDQLRQCMQDRRAARQAGSAAAPSTACQDLKAKLKGLHGMKRRGAALFARADHGTFDIKNDSGQFVTYTFDKGTVAAGTSASQVVIDRPDGQSVTLKLDGSTKFKGIASGADLKQGQEALVVSKDGTATLVAQRDKAVDKAGPASLDNAGAGDLTA
ncbi:MAG: hypothetical protein QOG03_292 [Actinomycetota bacterium]|nr:hypothetical protein [Actinomycetota bacterium]